MCDRIVHCTKPLHPQRASVLSSPPGQGRPGPMPSVREKHTILVVEDDEEVREIARAILEDLGCETIGAACGAGALEVLATEGVRVDALFSDIMMPGMNGFELAQQAKALCPDLKIILSSG